MDSTSQDASPTVVLDLIEAFRRSKVMFAAVQLGVFDVLERSPRSAASLAQELNCNVAAMQTLLESCVALGLLSFSDSSFSNLPAATKYLTSTSPIRMTGYITYSNNVMWQMWAHLEDAIRTGENRWKQTFGSDGPIFSHFFRTPEAMKEFLMGMHGFGMITSPRIVQEFDLSKYSCMCDLGGATGHWVIAACELYPNLKGIVFDLPHALDLAREMISGSSASDRLQVAGGDFFADNLPAADLYALGRIVHDWSEDKIRLLLKRIYEALPSGGALMIGEKIVNEDRSGPRWALMQSLNMLVCTEGKERSASEYRELLTEAGFGNIEVAITDLPLDCILAVKD
ncbi:MAG: class I SAM-dependent methyltransferase [Pirellulales bacterium]